MSQRVFLESSFFHSTMLLLIAQPTSCFIRYAAFAHASGVIGEGTFTCDTAGKISVTWNQVLKLDGSEWIASTADAEKAVLPSEISLADGECLQTMVHT